MTGEQRFSHVLNHFISHARSVYNSARKYDVLTEGMKTWVNNREDFMPQYGLVKTTFSRHLHDGTFMLVSEFVNVMHWVLGHFDSEFDRMKALLNAGTLLFCDTKEGQEHGWCPFSRPLGDILEDYIQQEVDRRVAEELRIFRILEEQKKLEERQKQQEVQRK